ncbi:hypothetical protein HDU76_014055 [Blyttiomyces sp. JEL0837]|nr:hypothetical protein HDU76_014055 [Blyttiomyces sp. JEL0837]
MLETGRIARIGLEVDDDHNDNRIVVQVGKPKPDAYMLEDDREPASFEELEPIVLKGIDVADALCHFNDSTRVDYYARQDVGLGGGGPDVVDVDGRVSFAEDEGNDLNRGVRVGYVGGEENECIVEERASDGPSSASEMRTGPKYRQMEKIFICMRTSRL